MKTKRISVESAIDQFYNRNKDKLLDTFGNERSAKANLKYNVPELPANYFKSYNQASKVFNDFIKDVQDPTEAYLKKAKRDAINSDIWPTQRSLNKRIDKNALIPNGTYLGADVDGYDSEVVEYYEVKNTDKVLAHIRHYTGNNRTNFLTWEYIDKDLI